MEKQHCSSVGKNLLLAVALALGCPTTGGNEEDPSRRQSHSEYKDRQDKEIKFIRDNFNERCTVDNMSLKNVSSCRGAIHWMKRLANGNEEDWNVKALRLTFNTAVQSLCPGEVYCEDTIKAYQSKLRKIKRKIEDEVDQSADVDQVISLCEEGIVIAKELGEEGDEEGLLATFLSIKAQFEAVEAEK